MKLCANEISSATSRVRIALAMKGVQVEMVTVGILGDGAENRQADYLGINPQGLVPALQTDEGELLTQSLAIVEYLDERFPLPPLLPKDARPRLLPLDRPGHRQRNPRAGATARGGLPRQDARMGATGGDVEPPLDPGRPDRRGSLASPPAAPAPTWPATRRQSPTSSSSPKRSTRSARASNWSNGHTSPKSWIGCGT